MKTNHLLLCWLLATLVFLVYSCNKDESSYPVVDGADPVLTLRMERIRTEIGREFRIQGQINDNDGISKIKLSCAEILLNKTIDVSRDSLVKAFNLDYKFKTLPSQTGDNFTVTVTVEDVLGKTVERSIPLTMDGDFTAPTFTVAPDENVTVLIKSVTRLNLRFSLTDDKGLGSVKIDIPELNVSESITSFENPRLFSYSSSVVLPSTAGSYACTITAKDAQDNETVRNIMLQVSQTPDFQKMYLIDVDNATLLNSDLFGVPALIERTAPYTYRARYYNKANGTRVRFAPQKTDFNPICYGIHPDDASKLTDEPDISQPIMLTSVGYNEITFNIQSGNFSVRAYTPTDTPIPVGSNMLLDPGRPNEGSTPLRLALIGAGLPGAGSWSPSSPLFLEQHATNKYLFFAEFNLQAGNSISFIIGPHHSWGWWYEPFWRWDRANDPETNVSNGGENPGNWTISTTGRYRFEFDTHLKRSRFYPIN
ncbi:hypothetical protein PQ465_13555 [Sphingobacterium oryzagri]|uniref:Uncharacterized protein n=1 Tax=Sphingobacterium oryzagri TaxID=3025669 RepID=A0ABY7WFM6_9SPHI|nr:hypothetical protein [Sphingobacterium sp. KACC 22765]WDF67331.1 hypothetical protein PQ465_13555 [Sphingobacterium sp. KACC 22765]